MTSREYLLSQAEHCRRTADESVDRFVAQELKRLAQEFEKKAHNTGIGTPAAVEAV
ncbi:MAG TPA: hypothetical protein VK522_11665 [Pseudolabrys sp.]|jgi:hypothetical protein|nr:hypothetical protein [Pseudolabrys sp.]